MGARPEWESHALARLREAGFRESRARRAVVAALARRECGASAREIRDAVEELGVRIGVASVYRTLELLAELGLVRSIGAPGERSSRFEPAAPDGSHHHHAVCGNCGNVETFEDPELERVLAQLAERLALAVDDHDVTLRGLCPDCLPRSLAPRDSRSARR